MRWRGWFLAIALVLASTVILFSLYNAPGEVDGDATPVQAWCLWLSETGSAKYVLGPLVMTVCAILPIPAECPALVNGIVFGAVVGTFITWAGALAGAQISFELSRRYGRPLAKYLLPSRMMSRIDETASHGGAVALLLARLIPLVSFTVLNWGAGMTSVRRSTFFWTTAVGVLPGAIVFTASGVGLLSLPEGGPGYLILIAVLTAALLLWLVHRVPVGGFGIRSRAAFSAND